MEITSDFCAKAAGSKTKGAAEQRHVGMHSRDSNFLNTVIIGEESWVYGYDPEMKFQSSQWKHSISPRPKKARWQVCGNVIVMLFVFFDYWVVGNHEYAPGTKISIRRSFILRRSLNY